MRMPASESNDNLPPKMIQIELTLDAYELIMGYVYGNLEWDSDPIEKQDMYDALGTIRRLDSDGE